MKPTSIVIPHYKTPRHLEWCLRCLEAFREPRDAFEIVVVDNGSGDAVVGGLRRRAGIVLVEREQGPDLDQMAHMEALDAGIARAEGDFIVAIHSDTFVFRRGWLAFLHERLALGDYQAYGPSHHRISPPTFAEAVRAPFGTVGHDDRWIRPVFTIYARDVFTTRNFADYSDVGEITAPLLEAGRAGFLSRREAARWAYHAGGTTKLELLQHRRRARRRKDRQWQRFLAREGVRDLLED